MCADKNVKIDQLADLPIIDISPLYNGQTVQRQSVGDQIAQACKTYGFFYIKNFNIPAGDIAECFAQSQKFFKKTSDFKEQYSIAHSDRFQGYEPPTDLESKEAYVLGPERTSDDPLVEQGVKYHGANMWPDMPGWKDVMTRQMDQMRELAKCLNRGLALGLGIEEGYFDNVSRDPMCALRLLHYPAHRKNTGIEQHTDWGALSLLIQDDIAGLEVLTPEGQWAIVPPIKDTIVVNIGEMVEIWTGGLFKATPHRVINRSEYARYSIAFFLDMDHDAVLKPVLKGGDISNYPPIRVSEFIDNMHERDYGGHQNDE